MTSLLSHDKSLHNTCDKQVQEMGGSTKAKLWELHKIKNNFILICKSAHLLKRDVIEFQNEN